MFNLKISLDGSNLVGENTKRSLGATFEDFLRYPEEADMTRKET